MISTKLASFGLAVALAVILPAAPANAQSPRTFVSAAGNDSNPCTFAAPCRHFQAAVNATAVGGEVDALDPAGYSPIIISHAITIEGQGWSYIAPPAGGGSAITINAGAGDKIVIRGVSLNGVGAAGTTTGILFNTGGSLSVQNTVASNFTNAGIQLAPNSSVTFSILDTVTSHNGLYGIEVFPSGGSGSVRGLLDRIFIDDNGVDGLAVFGSSFAGTIDVLIRDSSVANSGSFGIVSSSAGGSTTVTVQNTATTGNPTGLDAVGTAGILRVTKSTITRNTVGFNTSNSGTLESFGDNALRGNGTDGAPTATVSLK